MSTSAFIGGSEKVLEDGFTNSDSGYTDGGSAKEEYNPALDPANDAYWVQRARSSYHSSQTWFDTSVRRRMEDNMRLFNSDHPRGSRYREQAYAKRSQLFRPKTRSGVRKIEAATSAAFFATQDAVSCSPPNPNDKKQRKAAEVQKELLNYRLDQDIPWYITCIGAMQDAAKQGVVISKQDWNYREVDDAYNEDVIDELSGETMSTRTVYERNKVADHPDIRLRPVENIRFSPAADWRNPLQTSPYLIDMEPWFVGDVIEYAKQGPQGKYGVAFRKLSIEEIRSALKQSYDPVRQAREGQREDRYEEAASDIPENDIVWVHHNYIRIDGTDWYYATLGTEIMLSEEPVPASETTPLKERPYVLGMATIETHKTYPAGLVELGRPIQEEINDLTNLRIDNIRHIISPRYFIKRGTSIDVRSLMRNIAGGVTAMEDPQNDVNIRQIADTTSSSFQEQDRLAIEFDELVGTFNQSSVAANHNITERVGNTQMLGEAANQVTEMTIRILGETWVEKVLQQVMELIRNLESDEIVLAIVGQRMGVSPEVVFRMLDMPVKVKVNVGFGATNPQLRLQKVSMAFRTLKEIDESLVREVDKAELVTEVLGAVGYKSVERFFPTLAADDSKVDPEVKQLRSENEKLKQMIESGRAEMEAKGEIEIKKVQIAGQSRERIEGMKLGYQRERDQGQAQLAHKIEKGKWQLAMYDLQIKKEQNAMRKQELVQQRMALNHTITMDERQYELTRQQAEWQMGEELEEAYNTPAPDQAAPQVPDTTSKAAGTKPDSNPAQRTLPVSAKGKGQAKASQTKPVQAEPAQAGGEKRIASTPKLKGDDKAGVLARDRYGDVPFSEG
jgi:hypothetical protein